MGYHLVKIKKGILGEISKIQEELDELKDARLQKSPVLELCELSDLCGAIKCYLKKYYPLIEIEHLIKMADSTASAFLEGER
jgi:hypothetical protein